MDDLDPLLGLDAEAPQEEGELRLGTTERGVAANGVILALTRAARSFLLYDPSNEAIRHFLGALREAVESYLAAWGELPLVVRPFELVVQGEVVYLDRDRERSLAFRLYRDGVRKVSLEPELTWAETMKLLEILSIRYTGVRQAEDDLVVLLWKAGFTNIQIEAVEGFVPEEEVGDLVAGPVVSARGGRVDVPADFDLPPPPLGALGPLRYRELTEVELERIQEEDSAQQLPTLCVRLAGELLRAVNDPTNPMEFTEIVVQLREIRDFLLSEGLLSVLLRMVQLLLSVHLPEAAHEHERDVLLATFADERAVARLLHSVPRDAVAAPPEMVELLDLLPGNHLRSIVSVLATERGEASRRVARSLIARYVPKHGAWILEQLVGLDASLAVELLRVLAVADPAKALEGVQAVASRPELEIQLEALHVLSNAASDPVSNRILHAYSGASNEEIRVRSLELLGSKGVRSSFPAVAERVRREAALRLTTREAEAAGEALARMDPARALELFREWLRPRGLFRGILPGQTMLQWTGVSGMVYLPGDEPEVLVKQVAERAGSELANHCTACMVKRRRVLRGAVP